jgi:hypothetical protein
MSDHPRFYQFKGEPDVAHEAYDGGRLVSFVFRLADRWRARSKARQAAPAVASAGGEVEVNERAPAGVPAEFLPGTAEAMAPVQALHRQAPDEIYTRDFLIGSASTMRPQRGLLAAMIVVLAVLVAQGWSLLGQSSSQNARNPAASDAVVAQRTHAPAVQFAP